MLFYLELLHRRYYFKLHLLRSFVFFLSRALIMGKHSKKYHFQTKRSLFLYHMYFQMRKQHFYFILRGATPKNECTFYLDERLVYYIFGEMFVTSVVFLIISPWKLVNEDSYSQIPIIFVWGFEYVILAQIKKILIPNTVQWH